MDRQRILYEIDELETLCVSAQTGGVGVNGDIDTKDWIERVARLLPDVCEAARVAVTEAPETSHG